MTRAALLLLLISIAFSAKAQNVLVVVLDDIGIEKIGAYGYAEALPTPNITGLANSGVRFDRFWGFPACTQFRVSLLTGELPQDHGIGYGVVGIPGHERSFGLDPARMNIAHMASDAGYRTAFVGKWHAGSMDHLPAPEYHPLSSGFDTFRGGIAGSTVMSWLGTPGVTGHYAWERCEGGVADLSCALETTYSAIKNTDDAIAEIQGSEPFLVIASYYLAHKPFDEPPDNLHSYDGQCLGTSTPSICHLAAIEAVDSEVGRLLAAVDLADTTVFLAADNGTMEEAMTGPWPQDHVKGSLYEGGIHLPFIMAGEAVTHVGTVNALVQVTDFFATIAEIIGSTETKPDSVSLVPYLSSGWTPIRQTLRSQAFKPPGTPGSGFWRAAAREDCWKLIRFEDTAPGLELYDLCNDPLETTVVDPLSLDIEDFASYNDLREAVWLPEPPQLLGMMASLLFLHLLRGIRDRR